MYPEKKITIYPHHKFKMNGLKAKERMSMRIGELFKRIPKCKNCKYFEPDDNASWGECIRAESNRGVPVYTNSLAVAQDTETFHAFLKVHEDFGCVMFEPKDS